jgi:hypothetical protein
MIGALLYFHGLKYIRGLAVTIAAVSISSSVAQNNDVFFLSYGCCFSLGIAFWLLTKRLTLVDIILSLLFFLGALFQINPHRQVGHSGLGNEIFKANFAGH